MPKIATRKQMKFATSKLVNGDALRPDSNDMLAQTIDLPYDTVPVGDSWHIMTGNSNTNLWARIDYRHNIVAGK